MNTKKCAVMILDKKDQSQFLFKGFRKHKFRFVHNESVFLLHQSDFLQYDIFFCIVYENKDLFELLRFNASNAPIIVASENVKIIHKLKKLDCFPVVDLSTNKSISSTILSALNVYLHWV